MTENFMLEAELTEQEKLVRDNFAREYVKDFNQVKAAMRIGYSYMTAVPNSNLFMSESYTLKKIDEYTTGTDISDEKTSKNMIINGLVREANYLGEGSSHAARVSALSKLANIWGLEKNKTEITHKGGVIVVPSTPEGTNIDDWEAVAMAQQERISNNV